jgi:hypothetical protein
VGCTDFSDRFGKGVTVQGCRVSHGVHIDIRVFPEMARSQLVLCFGGDVRSVLEWMKGNRVKLQGVVNDLKAQHAPGPKG